MKTKVIATASVLVGMTLLPGLAMADSLTPQQRWACKWSGGLTPEQIAEILETQGQYLGPVPEFPERMLVGYPFDEASGVVVGYLPGSGGSLISYSLDVQGFDAPKWFSPECRAISDAAHPEPERVPIELTPCTRDPESGELHCK
jgi:hypothetical protein